MNALVQSTLSAFAFSTQPSMKFGYARDYKILDLHTHPELYSAGAGKQGVLLVEPCKSEILLHWQFVTPDAARESSSAAVDLFHRCKEDGNFAGMDMA